MSFVTISKYQSTKPSACSGVAPIAKQSSDNYTDTFISSFNIDYSDLQV